MSPRNLVFVCDGTLSSIRSGEETNAGQIYRLLSRLGPDPRQIVRYDPGVQGAGWRKWVNAASGQGVNRSIRAGYAFLAQNWRPGDRIFLFGYSRGAYAVRSLAGMIGRVGLLKPDYAAPRYVDLAFRFYVVGSDSPARRHFSAHRCHNDIPVEMLGIWDTVKSLGLPYPLLNRLAPMATEFHDHALATHIRHGYHALAIDEDRTSYTPILWERSPGWDGRLEQAWFPGGHGDVGGEVRGYPKARPLGNLSMNWMLRRGDRHGLHMPDGWRDMFPEDVSGPMIGPRRGIGAFFLLRRRRVVGSGDGEVVHLSIRERMNALPRYRPRGFLSAPNATER